MTLFNRRSILAGAAVLGMAFALPQAADARTKNFSVTTYNQMVKSGKPFLLSVNTEWCSTCAAQKRVISGLRKGAPYAGLTELEMDWDKYRGSKIGKDLKIPRRSTLIMFDGGKEVGRLVAGTGRSAIKKLIDKGLN